MFDLQLPLTCNPWTTLSNLTNKVRGKILFKKSSCVFLPSCVLYFLRQYVSSIYMCMRIQHILRFGACVRWVLQGLRTNLVTVNGSLKHHNTTSTKKTKKNAGIERSKKKKKTRTNHQQKEERTDAKITEEKEEKRKIMQRAGRKEEKRKKTRKQE